MVNNGEQRVVLVVLSRGGSVTCSIDEVHRVSRRVRERQNIRMVNRPAHVVVYIGPVRAKGRDRLLGVVTRERTPRRRTSNAPTYTV